MRYKILTVDDSKTVRIIVRKAFKAFDCEILEAGNGVEGLAIAAKENPDLILLDVTMPVMDGVEMLTKLKSDPALKGIPVMMLTAEGGRDHVLKIAKIGVRDYLVKPFKEDVLIEKAGRIIDLKPLSESPAKAKSIFDPATILVVEDNPINALLARTLLEREGCKVDRVAAGDQGQPGHADHAHLRRRGAGAGAQGRSARPCRRPHLDRLAPRGRLDLHPQPDLPPRCG